LPRNRTVRLAVLGSSVQRAAPSGRSSALKRRIIVGVLVLAALVLITVSFRSSALDGVQGTGATILKPFEVAADRVTRPFRDSVGWFHGLVNARNENKKLRAENESLRHQQILSEGAIQQNVQLQKDLDYHGPPSVANYRNVFASVLANPQSAIDQSVTISAGSSAGVTDASGALIGTVDKVTSGASRVMLLTNTESNVTATDLTSPAVVGVVRRGGGSSGVIVLDRVPKQPVVNVGDTVMTAGTLGSSQFPSKYPRGVPIGTVKSQSNNDASLFQNIQVQPFVDLTTIESVVVLVPKTTG
jgi:rod shape-determining protein MreC